MALKNNPGKPKRVTRSSRLKLLGAYAIFTLVGLILLGGIVLGFVSDWVAMLEVLGILGLIALLVGGVPWAITVLEDRND
jgi:hypothetical protein